MRLVVHGAQPGDGDVCVQLGGGQRRVAQEFLDDAQVGTALEQMGCRTVSQPVGADIGRAGDRSHRLVHDGARLTRVDTPTAGAEQ